MRIFLFYAVLVASLFGEVLDLVGKGYDDLGLEKNASCPIKFVPLEKNRDFVGVVQFKDGKMVAVSSPKYTFHYFYTEAPKNYKGIQKVYLTDYKTKKLIDANSAYYVFGSRVMGVGGDDIIPFEKKEDAEEFSGKNSGKKVYDFSRIDKNFIKYLELK